MTGSVNEKMLNEWLAHVAGNRRCLILKVSAMQAVQRSLSGGDIS